MEYATYERAHDLIASIRKLENDIEKLDDVKSKWAKCMRKKIYLKGSYYDGGITNNWSQEFDFSGDTIDILINKELAALHSQLNSKKRELNSL